MEGISGMVKGVDASLGSFGKPWLDPWGRQRWRKAKMEEGGRDKGKSQTEEGSNGGEEESEGAAKKAKKEEMVMGGGEGKVEEG